MKKLILFLLLPLWAMAQTSNGGETEFDYGIKNNSTQTITTPTYLGTFGTDGTQGKIPSAYIEKTDNKQNSLAVDGTGAKYPTVDAVNAALPKTYTTTVYVNTNDPNISTIFDDENPPTVNDDGLKSNTDNLYIGLDASAWVYNGSTYVTKIVPASSNFYINSTSIDAGNSKDVDINRIGAISTSRYIAAGSGLVSRLGSSNIENLGSYLRLANKVGSENNQFQLNASNGVDLWNYSSGIWNKRFTFSSDGNFNSGRIKISNDYSGTEKGLIIENTTLGTYINSTQSYGDIYFGGNGKNVGYIDFQGTYGLLNVPAHSVNGTLELSDVGGYVPKIQIGGGAWITQTGVGMPLSYNSYDGHRFRDYDDNIIARIGKTQPDKSSYFLGNVSIGTSVNDGVNALQVNGPTKTTALTLSTTPTTSSGAYRVLTYNETTDAVESVASDVYAPLVSPSFTGTPTAPTAPVGTNTPQIATMEALQAAKQNLQSVLNVGGYAELDSGQSSVGLLQGGVGDRYSQFSIENSSISIDKVSVSISNYDNISEKEAGINLQSGGLVIKYLDNATDKSTELTFDDPIGVTVLKLPAKNIDGTYTLATTDIKPYKSYTALLSQTGTNAPVATVLENTLGGTIVWTRTGTGAYTGTLTGMFPDVNKAFCIISLGQVISSYGDNINLFYQVTTNDSIGLTTVKTSINQDDVLAKTPIEIRVYN